MNTIKTNWQLPDRKVRFATDGSIMRHFLFNFLLFLILCSMLFGSHLNRNVVFDVIVLLSAFNMLACYALQCWRFDYLSDQMKARFEYSNNIIPVVYTYSNDIKFVNKIEFSIKNRELIQYIDFDKSQNLITKNKHHILAVKFCYRNHADVKIKLIPLNDLGKSYDKVCWYVSQQKNLFDLHIKVDDNGTVATFKNNKDDIDFVKVQCLLTSKSIKHSANENKKVINLSINK